MAQQKSKKMTVLFDATPLVSPTMSGVGHYVAGLIRSLAEHHSDLELVGYYFNFLGRKSVAFPIEHPQITFKPIRYFPGRILNPIQRITGLQLPIDVLVFRRYDVQFFTNYVSLPTLRNTPQLCAIYDMGMYDHPDYVQDKNLAMLKKLLPKSVARADKVITISEFTSQRIADIFGVKDSIVTPIPPVRLTANQKGLQERLRTLGIQRQKYILSLGTIEPRKNIENLISAYALLPKKLRDTYALVLAGGKGWKDAPILKKIEQAQQEGLRIILTGYVDDVEKASLYDHTKLFVMPAHYEGFGMPVIEAMNHSARVATSDIPVFREIGKDVIAFFDKDDPKDIARIMSQQLNNGKKPDYSKVLAAYNWQDIANTVYDYLKSKK